MVTLDAVGRLNSREFCRLAAQARRFVIPSGGMPTDVGSLMRLGSGGRLGFSRRAEPAPKIADLGPRAYSNPLAKIVSEPAATVAMKTPLEPSVKLRPNARTPASLKLPPSPDWEP